MTPTSLKDALIDDTFKGVPGGTAPFPIGQAGAHNWNVLREDLVLPLAVLKHSAMEQNSAWMRNFLMSSGAVLAPHGKTTMSPQLFQRQLDDGAWAITLANIAQVQVARRFAVSRIILANQLVGRQAINYILNEMRRDPEFDFYCLVDSTENVAALAAAAKLAAPERPLQVLLEGGVAGCRTGARTLEQGLAVAKAVSETAPYLALRGVEGFEGVISAPTPQENAARVLEFLYFLGDLALVCDSNNLFATGPLILSAGGSAYYDLVARVFSAIKPGKEVLLVIRSGCYLVHDSIMYEKFIKELIKRSEQTREWGRPPQAALEVWAYVQSRPEPGRVILTLGKRDASYDAGLPAPLGWVRPGDHSEVQTLGSGHNCVEINDQHLFMNVPETSPLRFGDMVGFGISHPCLTFDKWQFIPVVDDDYNVVSAIRTYF